MALLLTGRSGIGKTTVVRTVARKLEGLELFGFYTEEIHSGARRLGFHLVTFAGDEAIIAHVDLPPARVGTYGVDVAAIDRFGANLKVVADPAAIYLVDESAGSSASPLRSWVSFGRVSAQPDELADFVADFVNVHYVRRHPRCRTSKEK